MAEKASVQQEKLDKIENPTGPVLKPPKKKRKWKRWAVLGVVVLLVGFWLFSAIRAALANPFVLYLPVGREDIDSIISTSGTIVSDESKTYFAPTTAKVAQVNFKRGEQVKKGDVIAVFDIADLQSSLRKAQIALENAQLNYEDTMENLDDSTYELAEVSKEIRKANAALTNLEYALAAAKQNYDGFPAPDGKPTGDPTIDALLRTYCDNGDYEALDQAVRAKGAEVGLLNQQRAALRKDDMSENAIQVLDNNLENLQISVNDITRTINQAKGGIVADFDGILTQLNLVEGGTVTAGMTVAVLEANQRVKVSFSLNKYDIQRLALDQTAVVTFGSRTLEGGVVTHIDGAAINTGAGAAVAAEVTVDDPEGILKLGMDADLDILSSSKSGVVAVPIETVKTDKIGDYVYILTPTTGEKAKAGEFHFTKVYVTIGISDDSYMEILSGVAEGDLVATVIPKGAESGIVVTGAMGSGSGGTMLQLGEGGPAIRINGG